MDYLKLSGGSFGPWGATWFGVQGSGCRVLDFIDDHPGITHIVTAVLPMINLLTKSPWPSKGGSFGAH